ncbi:MAG: alpha/beta hydrolase, partial [Minisyncoccia bacterium]
MHLELGKLSRDFLQIQADKSGHFVWMDQPDVMIDAVRILLDKINSVC